MIFGARLFALLILSALAIVPTHALAQSSTAPDGAVIHDTENHFSLDAGKALAAATAPVGSEALHYFVGGHGLVASVTRFDAANRSAFRKDKKEAFFDDIERGLASGNRKFKRRSRKSQKVNRAPMLDLEFTRLSAHGVAERVWMRLVFRYRFTVVATASVPESAPRKVRRLARTFVHALQPQRGR